MLDQGELEGEPGFWRGYEESFDLGSVPETDDTFGVWDGLSSAWFKMSFPVGASGDDLQQEKVTAKAAREHSRLQPPDARIRS